MSPLPLVVCGPPASLYQFVCVASRLLDNTAFVEGAGSVERLPGCTGTGNRQQATGNMHMHMHIHRHTKTYRHQEQESAHSTM